MGARTRPHLYGQRDFPDLWDLRQPHASKPCQTRLWHAQYESNACGLKAMMHWTCNLVGTRRAEGG
ncbi:hypothetical protein BKA56DRAFT_585590 [Ilyonectria sp. MPI-CAGE-AT-0026]|nr:hypothetical protein BKA56DRAFT_585590 [Ilyonectria sp. MPI-CAGE-AT-0026]